MDLVLILTIIGVIATIIFGIPGYISVYYAKKEHDKKNQTSVILEAQTDDPFYDRFTRAIDQLGSEKTEIRLGAISALEIIANKSDEYYWRIMENLTAYIRRNSSIEDQRLKEQGKVQFDIQAILSVIKKCNKPDDFIEPCGLDLQDTYLCKANLSEALLERVNLQGANLKETNFTKAHLEGADLYGADLTGADLTEAHLEGANLKGANFKGANLKKADLEGADFIEMDLEEHYIVKKANFEDAKLEGAHLKEAYLAEVNLKKANFEGADLEEANFEGANLTEANLEGANLKRAFFGREPYFYLGGANLTKARLGGADLTGASFEGANIKEADFEGATLEGADFTEVDFEEDDIDDSLFPVLYKHNLTIDQLYKVKSLYGAKNLNHELEASLRKNHPRLFEETDDHKWYRENFIQFKS